MKAEEIYAEEMERWKHYQDVKGDYVGYDSKECIECGRSRVDVFNNNGKLTKICEKCGTDQSTGESYYNEYGTWFEHDCM